MITLEDARAHPGETVVIWNENGPIDTAILDAVNGSKITVRHPTRDIRIDVEPKWLAFQRTPVRPDDEAMTEKLFTAWALNALMDGYVRTTVTEQADISEDQYQRRFL